MISYDFCFSRSDLIYLVWWPLSPSMLLQMAIFHSFLRLIVCHIYIYIYTTSSLSIHVNGHVGCFHMFSSVQSLSHVQLFVTPWIAARQASLSITNSQSSPRLMSIESEIPSSHLILCHPLLLLPPVPRSIRVFSNESTLCMRWPKYWSFSFSISPSKAIANNAAMNIGVHASFPISFRLFWLCTQKWDCLTYIFLKYVCFYDYGDDNTHYKKH